MEGELVESGYALFKVLPWHMPGWTKKNHKESQQDTKRPAKIQIRHFLNTSLVLLLHQPVWEMYFSLHYLHGHFPKYEPTYKFLINALS
jgi:hypothetical protein